jgi:putative IMPACT (imprinted ancient) family translation regulator
MLNILSHSGIGEITVVVTRYFGGTLLGTGGLVKAYQDSVREALRDLPLKPWEPVTPLWVRTELAGLSAALNRIRQAAGTVSNTEFAGESAVIRANVPSRNAEALVKTLSGIRGAEIRELQGQE